LFCVFFLISVEGLKPPGKGNRTRKNYCLFINKNIANTVKLRQTYLDFKSTQWDKWT